MRKTVLLFFLPFLLASSDSTSTQEAIGTTVYVEGDVSLVRDGANLSPDAVAIGLPIQNYDQMKTGDDGNAQVQVTTARAPAATITVSPDTQFTFELSVLQGRQRSSIDLITGSLSLKVSSLSQDQDLGVQAENTVLGVRGTEFQVSTSEAGDVLVTCSTGAVACTASNGTQLEAAPGTVVENQAEGQFHAVPVSVADLAAYRQTWAEQRRAFVRANAFRLIQASAGRYTQLRASFDRDYEILMRQRAVIDRWSAEDRKGAFGTGAEVERDKRAVAVSLLRLRRTQFLLERVFYRLVRLRALHDQGFGKGTLPGGLTTDQFFDQLQRDRGGLELRMAMVRNVTRLYAYRNRGEDPTSLSPATREQRPFRGRLRR